MNIERTNQWLTIIANFGVLLGIFFLAWCHAVDQTNGNLRVLPELISKTA